MLALVRSSLGLRVCDRARHSLVEAYQNSGKGRGRLLAHDLLWLDWRNLPVPMLRLTCLVLLCVVASPVLAQTTPPPSAPAPAAGGAAPQDPKASPLTREELDALARRVEELAARSAAQDALIAQQAQQLEAAKAELAAGRAASAADEDAELASLLGDGDGGEVSGLEEKKTLRFYGFMEAGLQKSWGSLFDTGVSQSDASNFVLGNVNLYMDAEPVPEWRSLIEVRFTTLPHGAERFTLANAETTRIDTEVQDSSDATGGFLSQRLSGIILERAQIEWRPSDYANLRVGYFLTPFGIYNVDHGTPARLMLRPPLFIAIGLFPERQTGVELFGRIHFTPWELGYSLYVSNGRTITATDLDEDKALGGRVTLATRGDVGFQLGGSFFYGSTEDYEKELGIRNGDLGLVRTETIAYDELALAGDVSLDIGSHRLRAEYVARLTVYEPGKHEPYVQGVYADSWNQGAYLLWAYELPWWGLEPFLNFDYFFYPRPRVGEAFLMPGAGLNIYLTEATQLRFQYSYTRTLYFNDSQSTSDIYLHSLASRLVVAY